MHLRGDLRGESNELYLSGQTEGGPEDVPEELVAGQETERKAMVFVPKFSGKVGSDQDVNRGQG